MPIEVHEHFDAAGVKTGHTIITRESMWDEESRGRALRLGEFEAGMCPCGCGLQMSVAHDEKSVMRVERFMCSARRAIAIVERAEREKHKDDHLLDGVFFHAVPHTED